MAISFNEISPSVRVPGHYAEFDGSKARQGPALKLYKTLIIGQRLSTGSVLQKVPTLLSSADQARDFWGVGSMMEQMARKYFLNNTSTETWGVALDDAGGGTKASTQLTFPTQTVSANGSIYFYVGGVRCVATVQAGNDEDDVALAVRNACVLKSDLLSVTTSVTTNVLTITARHAGTQGNNINIAFNLGSGETFPPGVLTPTGSGMSGGATNPDIDDLWPELGEEQYDFIICGIDDSFGATVATTTIDKMAAELERRWGPDTNNEGNAYFASSLGWANLQSLGSQLNSLNISVLGLCEAISNTAGCPTTPWEMAAAYGGQASRNLQIDPARPLQTLPLKGTMPIPINLRFTQADEQVLLENGIATMRTGAGGINRIQRAITTYQETPTAAPDTAYLDVNTPATLAYLRYSWRNNLLTRYPRHKIADDGTRFAAGQSVITPKIGRAEALSWFRQMEEIGLVEDFDQFKAELIVERDVGDPNRMNWLLPVNVVNQFRISATKIEFRL